MTVEMTNEQPTGTPETPGATSDESAPDHTPDANRPADPATEPPPESL